MNKMIFAAGAAALSLASTSAMADETKAFNGAYVGAVAGYDHVILSDGTDSGSKDGLVYGVALGYDLNLGGGVVGAEAELTGSTVKERETSVFAAGDSLTAKAGRDIYVGARAGFAVTPSTLLYGKVGYANGRIRIDYVGTPSVAVANNVDGLRLGAGVEQSFGPFSGRLEYRYTNYSNIKANGVDTGIDVKRHQVVAGLFARF